MSITEARPNPISTTIPSYSPAGPRLCAALADWQQPFDASQPHVIGVLTGEGIGPEVVGVTLELLAILQQHTSRRFHIRRGGLIGNEARRVHGSNLTAEVIDFSEQIFADQGALFCGPGGDRFVYELRIRFDLYCKFTPLQPLPPLDNCGVLRPEHLHGIDIVAVRENTGGLYQGTWSEELDEQGRKVATQSFSYCAQAVDRILHTALQLAARRRKRLAVVLKPGGVPSISRMWSERTRVLAADSGVEIQELEIDNAAYQLIANPHQFDVIVSPNMFGDVLADCGALLLGSRGMSYSGNFGSNGIAVYQTGHGAARDLAGMDVANPVGQVLSMAMMLRESFQWQAGADLLTQAVESTLAAGYRTRDIAAPDSTVLGARAMGEQLGNMLRELLRDTVI